MERIYIDELIKMIKDCVDRHNLGTPGAYSRYTFGEGKNLGINEYGVADAANILYSINDFAQAQEDRADWIKVLQGMQNPETGMYQEPTHHTIHTTAHCMAALDLFDAKPLYPCTYLKDCLTKEGLYHKLENDIRWETAPWRDSHIGAGTFVCLTNTDAVDLQWKDWYFDWCWENTAPESGFMFFGKEKKTHLYLYMASGFHYFFNHEAEHRPMRYPDKVIDSCLSLMEELPQGFLEFCGFIEIDVVYCLTRAMRQTPHRFYEAKAALEEFAKKFFVLMYVWATQNIQNFDDLHCLFGSVCCMAELQSALPGKIMSSKPMRLVLDRRPFI